MQVFSGPGSWGFQGRYEDQVPVVVENNNKYGHHRQTRVGSLDIQQLGWLQMNTHEYTSFSTD